MMGLPSSREHGINPYIWCVVGALIGAAASLLAPGTGKIVMIENILVGVFGAFIGGDFVVAMLSSTPVDEKVFHVSSLGIAIAGALAALFLLRLMRGAVGPMRGSKSKASQRR